MADLITSEDLLEYGLTSEQAATALVSRLISAASAQVVDAAGTPLGGATSRITLAQPSGPILVLPGLPITEVHSVTVRGAEVSDYLITAGGLLREGGWWIDGKPTAVTVEYSHGIVEIPADIKDLTCRMVLAGVLNSLDGPDGMVLNNGNLSSIAIDDFRESYATGADVEAVTEMDLPQRVRDRLAARFGNGGSRVRGTW